MPAIERKTVRADQVREGDRVEWPKDCGVLRKIEDVSLDDDAMTVSAWASWDDYDYEWQAHQLVEVWRDAR